MRNSREQKVSNFLLNSDPLFLDFAQKEHSFIIAKSGFGKSYLAGVLAEENIQALTDTSLLLFDRMGVFCTLDLPNNDEKTLNEWNSKVPFENYQIKARGFNIQIWIPKNQQANYDTKMYSGVFSIKPNQFSPYVLSLVFNMGIMDPQVNLYRKAVNDLARIFPEFSLMQLIDHIQEHAEEWHFKPQSRDALFSKLEALNELQLFDVHGIEIHQLIVKGQIIVLDISLCDERTACIIVNLVTERILRERSRISQQIKIAQRRNCKIYIRNPIPQVHIIVDEAHNFLPGNEIFSKGIKEGRNIGVKFTAISQSPDLTEDLYANITHLFIGLMNYDKHIAFMKSILPVSESLGTVKDNIKSLERGCFYYYNLKEKTKKRIRIRPRKTMHTATTEIDDETQFMLKESEQYQRIPIEIKSNPDEIYDPSENSAESNIEGPAPLTEKEKQIFEWDEAINVEEITGNEPIKNENELKNPVKCSESITPKPITKDTVNMHFGYVKIIFKHQKSLQELEDSFLLQDTGCKTRESAIQLLNSFYQKPIDITEKLTILRLMWVNYENADTKKLPPITFSHYYPKFEERCFSTLRRYDHNYKEEQIRIIRIPLPENKRGLIQGLATPKTIRENQSPLREWGIL